MSKVEVWRTIHAQNILYMLGQVFLDIDVGEMQLQFPEENQIQLTKYLLNGWKCVAAQ